jgi:LysR family nod box-dependent transcriptional activator
VLPEHPHAILFEDTYTVIAWAGSSVVGDTTTLDEYTALGHVIFGSEARGTPWLERWFNRHYGDARRVEVMAHNFTMLPHLVVGTDRIATVQTRLARLYERGLPLKLIPPPIELPKLTEVLQWNIHRDMDPAGRWLRSKLMDQAKKLA